MFRFFLNAERDARCDPFFPCPRWRAWAWVVWNWRWLRSPDGPYSSSPRLLYRGDES